MQTIGERLEEARKRKGISIREAAEATKIRSDYLHKFESNQFDLNLAEIYVRGFLRTYALYLNLPAEKLLNDYAALGRSQPRQRQPSREIYGRMDLSVASSAEERAAEKSAAKEEQPGQQSSSGSSANQRPSHLGRSGSSLPKGPAIPPQLIFKGGIALVVLVVGLLLYWLISSFVSPAEEKKSSNPQGSSIAATESSISLIALNSVRVKVTARNADGSAGEVLLPDTNMARGEIRTVRKPGPILIWASEGKNLQIELNGKRYPMPFEGYNRAQIN
ncbi:MAG: helix-turn-helix domain-containing protein [Opitutaceae bacterium]|nr:helix-turn-helix domain-containing protein [Cephaloticoccus sp.]MCP5531200.1 helix-turn-helix domain-containing protein [Opitutaceae bacterium]